MTVPCCTPDEGLGRGCEEPSSGRCDGLLEVLGKSSVPVEPSDGPLDDPTAGGTMPTLLGLYSLVSLWAGDLLADNPTPYAAAWYRKTNLTFTHAIGAVRLTLRLGDILPRSPQKPGTPLISPDRAIRMAQALCFAA